MHSHNKLSFWVGSEVIFVPCQSASPCPFCITHHAGWAQSQFHPSFIFCGFETAACCVLSPTLHLHHSSLSALSIRCDSILDRSGCSRLLFFQLWSSGGSSLPVTGPVNIQRSKKGCSLIQCSGNSIYQWWWWIHWLSYIPYQSYRRAYRLRGKRALVGGRIGIDWSCRGTRRV